MRVHVSAAEECLEALLGVVVHVVTGRRLRRLKEPCVYLRGPSTRAIVSNCIGDGGFAFSQMPGDALRANSCRQRDRFTRWNASVRLTGS